MKKCVVLSDSFKGSISSTEIGRIVKEECVRQFTGCAVSAVPVADGGEGTAECFEAALGAVRIPVKVSGPFGEQIDTFYVRKGKTAVIEMAKAAGLPMAAGRLDPLNATTYGVGEMMRHALENGCEELVLGLGGSATNDAGCGMASALGVRFYNTEGQLFIPVGGTLGNIADVDCHGLEQFGKMNIRAMCDIENPLVGKCGAAYVFAPQKGADEKAVQFLDRGLAHFADVVRDVLGQEVSALPGAGAAGGMGAGVAALLKGDLQPGIEVVMDLIHFEEMVCGADLVITGEGRLDAQSLNGKAVIGVARRAKKLGIPVVALVGDYDKAVLEDAYEAGVTAVFGINQQIVTLEKARAEAPHMLRLACRNLFAYAKALRA